MRIPTLIATATCLVITTTSLASEDRVEAGNGKAEQAGCTGCHGADGVATESGLAIDKHVPNLAAEPDLYVQFQLVFFRKNLGAYYASLVPPEMHLPPDPAPEESELGEKESRR